MARVEIEPKMAAALKRLKKLQGRIEDPAPILQEVGEMLRKTTVSRFYSKTSPTGRKWKRTKRRRHALRDGRVQRGSTLVLTGDLRDSIRAVVSGGNVEVGTDIWYGRLHQEGGRLDARNRVRARYRSGGGGRFTVNPKNIARLTRLAQNPDAAAAEAARKTLALLGGKSRARKQRRVRIPPRRFLGVSKRDRKRTTKILIDKLSEAMK